MDFFPITNSLPRRVKAIPTQTSEMVVLGPTEFAPAVPSLEKDARIAVQKGGLECVVFPIGKRGRLLWSEVPLPLSLKIAGIRPEAVFAVTRDAFARVFADGETEINLSELLDRLDGQVGVVASVDADLVDPQFPSLVARSRTLSSSELESIRTAQGALKAGLVHILGDMDLCHELAQSLEGMGSPRHADYWHAIVHRREPDYGNAKYWFRSVGSHPVFPALAKQAREILQSCPDPDAASWCQKLTTGTWDAFAFVDLCREAAMDEESPLALAARQIQWAEMLLLLKACATGVRL